MCVSGVQQATLGQGLEWEGGVCVCVGGGGLKE